MTDKEIYSLFIKTEFNKLICTFKEENNLTWDQVYALYCFYFETVQFFATEQGETNGIQ